LIAVGAAVATSAALSAGAKHDVLALSRPVPAGRTLTADDLRTVRVSADASVATVPAAEESSVLGQRTSVDLVPGSLLTNAALGGAPVPGKGQALLGVAFKPGQLPGRPLSRGDQAELITTPSDATTSAASSGSGSADTSPTAVPVTVDAEGAVASDGTTVVDLVLPADAAPQVAAQAAAGQLVLVLLPRAGS
jgi:SAF domain